MNEPRQRAWPTLLLGVVIALVGLTCVGGGVTLVAWRLLAPDEAVLLPPGAVITPPPTPSPAWLVHPVEPPPLPGDVGPVAILPVSDPPTATPSAPPPSATPMPRASVTPSATETQIAVPTSSATPRPFLMPTAPPTGAAARVTESPIPSLTPSNTPTLTATPTLAPSDTPIPTASPSPTFVPHEPDRLVIPSIGLDAPIVPVGQHPVRVAGQVYSQWDVPNTYAVGWHQNSAAAGEAGNIVLNGHHNIYGEVFRYLRLLKPGDLIRLEAAGERFTYIVAQTMTLAEEGQPINVRQDNARWILPTDDQRLTLVTCWPYLANSHRLVVVALPPAALGIPSDMP